MHLAYSPSTLPVHECDRGCAEREPRSASERRWDLLLGDFDLLRLRFLALRHADRQHAVLVGRADAVAVDGVGQREGARKRPVETLAAMQALGLLQRPLARKRQDVVLEGQMNVFA